jgi:hypothetical protein
VPLWQVLVAGAAVVAVWVTLEADFLRYPEWLAAQKADFILGPVFIGLYFAAWEQPRLFCEEVRAGLRSLR